VLQYHHEKKFPLPVNLGFCFEEMEESGRQGLDELVRRESLKGGYFDGVDCVCIVSTTEHRTNFGSLTSSLTTTGSTHVHLHLHMA